MNDILQQWKLVVAYELYKGMPLKVLGVVFMPREPEKDKPKIWVKRPDQYRVAYIQGFSVGNPHISHAYAYLI